MIKVLPHHLVLESRFERLVYARTTAVHRAQQSGQSRDATAAHASEQPGSDGPEQDFRASLESFPAAAYITDPEGWITHFNEAASDLWGLRPELRAARWCGSWKLFSLDQQPLAHEDCPMAISLRENRPLRGNGAIAERPDGTLVSFLAHPTPLHDDSGALVGAVNMLLDITGHENASVEPRSRARRQIRRAYMPSATTDNVAGQQGGLSLATDATRRRSG